MALYLVTGGTGFLGSALVRRLLREGHDVRVLDNNTRGSVSRLDGVLQDVEFVEGDIRDQNVVEHAMRGVRTVCHLAFVNGTEFFYTQPELVLDVGVKGVVNILDASIAQGVRDFVLVSSSEVYQTPPVVPTDETVPLSIPDPLNPRYSYGAAKIISEIMAINYGRSRFERVVIIRPHNVYGPNMGWEHVIPQFALRMMALGAEPELVPFQIQGSGNQTRAFVFVDDFIDGMWLAMSRGEHLGIYHVGTQDEVTIAELAEQVARVLDRRICIVPGEPASGGTLRRVPDIGKLVGLGYRPKVALADGLRLTVPWYEEHAPQGVIRPSRAS